MRQVEPMKRALLCSALGDRLAHSGRHEDRLVRQRPLVRAAFLVLFAASLGAIMWHDAIIKAFQLVASPDWITSVASRYGPVVIVALMVVAVVASPVPSGPIALAAGALYGTFAGGCLAVIGALGGAMIAFGVSRRFGHRALRTSTHPVARWMVRSRSQNRMMLLVMAVRLVPFISFDAVSYCAGLTRLDAWRFAIATFFGVMPVAFAFAALGAGMTVGGILSLPAVMACVITLVLPVGLCLRHRGSTPTSNELLARLLDSKN